MNTTAAEKVDAPARDLWALGLLPVLLAGSFAGLVGVYWDIAWHIDIGRDTFFSPPHNALYSSMAIVLLVSAYGLWRDRRDSPFHLHLGRLRLHPGLLVVAVAAALQLLFAPLDDMWHRLFGADVALWAPMHLVGLLSMGVGILGGLICAWLERSLSPNAARARLHARLTLAFAALLLGWITLLIAEYEYSVLQFPSLLHPILLAGLPSFVLVLAARLRPWSWSATWAALGFTAFRLILAGWLMATASFGLAGYSRPMIPIMVMSALAVDMLASRGHRPWLQGAVAAAVTLGVNTLLINAGNGLQWAGGMLITAMLPALLLGAATGALGAAVGSAVTGDASEAGPSRVRSKWRLA